MKGEGEGRNKEQLIGPVRKREKSNTLNITLALKTENQGSVFSAAVDILTKRHKIK